MKSVAIALMLAALLAAEIAIAGQDGPLLLLAPAAVVLGVVAASCLQGELTWLSVVAGAASPLALSWLGWRSPSLALGVMCALWLAPRLWLARSGSELLRLAVVSLGAAALAALVTSRFLDAEPIYHLTACVFGGGSLALAAVVLPTDTVTASSLASAAALLDGPTRDGLLAAAELHRQRASSARGIGAKDTEWRALLRLVDRRLALLRASGKQAERERAKVEHELVAQIEALSRADEPSADASATAEPPPEPPTTEPSPEPPAKTQPMAVVEPTPQASPTSDNRAGRGSDGHHARLLGDTSAPAQAPPATPAEPAPDPTQDDESRPAPTAAVAAGDPVS